MSSAYKNRMPAYKKKRYWMHDNDLRLRERDKYFVSLHFWFYSNVFIVSPIAAARRGFPQFHMHMYKCFGMFGIKVGLWQQQNVK